VLGILSVSPARADRHFGHALVTPPARHQERTSEALDFRDILARFEPLLDFFGGCHSIQLSYERDGWNFTAVSPRWVIVGESRCGDERGESHS